MGVVRELRCGDRATTSRKHGGTGANLSPVARGLPAAGEEGLEIRQRDPADEQRGRKEQVIAHLAMENELLRGHARHTEEETPYLGRRSS